MHSEHSNYEYSCLTKYETMNQPAKNGPRRLSYDFEEK